MSFPVDALPTTFALSDDEKATIQLAFQWLFKYLSLSSYDFQNPDAQSHRPTPTGTLYEVWTTLNMVYMLAGIPTTMFPMQQVSTAVNPPPDFIGRIGKLIHRLQSSEVDVAAQSGSAAAE